MSEEPSASSNFPPSLSTSTMASTSPTPSSTVSPMVLSASPSVPPSVTITTLFATPTASNQIPGASPVLSSAVTYVGGAGSPLLSTTSVISDSSPQSMSSSSVDGTTTATSGNASTHISSFASQNSLYPETSTSPTQASTTNEKTQTTSSAPVSVTISANRNVSESLPISIGASTQPGGALATYTQIGTTSSSNSFFNNRGAVIGTFVVVAILSTAIFACLCIAWRRRLQRRTRDGMFKAITLPRDDTNRGLREGPHDQPTMSMIGDSTVSFTPTYRSDTLLHGISAEEMFAASISASATGNTTNGTGPQYDGPFSDYFAIDRTSRGLTGLAITANSRMDSPVPSLAPSTPSIYPPSLPPMETENEVTRSMLYSMPLSTPSINPPPRPPRRRRSPPPPSGDLIEAAAMPSSPTTPVCFVTVVPPCSSPCTPDSFSPPTSVKDAKHKSSRLSEELQLLTPPSSMYGHSQTDSQPCCTTTAAPVLDHPINVQLERANF